MLACRTSATLTRDPILDARDVEEIAAVVGDQRIDEQHVGAEIDEPARQVAADEPQAARDHHAPAAVEIQVAHAATVSRARLQMLLANDQASTTGGSTSTPVLKIRRKLKNCDLP